MEVKYLFIFLFSMLFIITSSGILSADTLKGNILFDSGHAQDAGNADWLIQGGYSDFADLLSKHGYDVHESQEPLTLEVLQLYDVLVIPEPNNLFSDIEQNAIIEYIQNGGSVFFIGNHLEADRNRNGTDAVRIFNQFVDQLGFRFEDANIMEANLSAEPVKGEYKKHPITYKINEMAIWSGTSIEILEPDKVSGLIFFYKWNYGQPALAFGNHGQGKFVAVGDSAIFDDGSGTKPHENLHKGIIEYDHKQLALNIINWLSGQPEEDI